MFWDLVMIDDKKTLAQSAKKLGVSCFIVAKERWENSELESFSGKKNFRSCFLLKKSDEKALQKFRGKTDFTAILGGNPGINKFASSSKQVDFLVAPCTPEKSSIDTAIMRTAKENNVSIAVPLNTFDKLTAFQESQLFRHYLLVAKLCKRFRVKCFPFSAAARVEELKTAGALLDFGKALGFSEKQLGAWHNGL